MSNLEVWREVDDERLMHLRLERLMSDDLAKLPHLLSLSRRTMRAITQNLIFSLSVLAIAVGLAIPGILLPVTGALLHELSSLPVIVNAARLIGVKEQAE